jgi:hypothetical protein
MSVTLLILSASFRIVAHLFNQRCDILPKLLGNGGAANPLVLDRVMQERGDDEVRVLAAGGLADQLGHLQQVIDVRGAGAALALLFGVPARGHLRRIQNLGDRILPHGSAAFPQKHIVSRVGHTHIDTGLPTGALCASAPGIDALNAGGAGKLARAAL